MSIFWKQFCRNMLVGTIYSALWFYVFYKIFDNFWIPTILTNTVGFFIGRYFIYKEGRINETKEN